MKRIRKRQDRKCAASSAEKAHTCHDAVERANEKVLKEAIISLIIYTKKI